VIEVSEGLVKVNFIEALHETDEFIVYMVNTATKRPEVISWNSSTVTLLPADKDWGMIRPMDYTVIRFPEKRGFTSVYQEERYCVFFIQFKTEHGTIVWEKDDTGS
jgi:hypothetical protein